MKWKEILKFREGNYDRNMNEDEATEEVRMAWSQVNDEIGPLTYMASGEDFRILNNLMKLWPTWDQLMGRKPYSGSYDNFMNEVKKLTLYNEFNYIEDEIKMVFNFMG
jgi:hypothetical protein